MTGTPRCVALPFLIALTAVEAPSVRAQIVNALKGPERATQAAAEEGRPEDQLRMGRLYLEGRVVPRDRAMAYFWFNIAAANGSTAAAAERDRLERLLTPAQVAQAEALSREWMPKEVLATPALREAFSLQLSVLLSDAEGAGFMERVDHLVSGQTAVWETRVRFPGATSLPCHLFIDRRPPETAGDQKEPEAGPKVLKPQDQPAETFTRKKASPAALSGRQTLLCTLFNSSDARQTQAFFDDFTQKLWELLPQDWLKDLTLEKFLPNAPTHKDSKWFVAPKPGPSVSLGVGRPPTGWTYVMLGIHTTGGCNPCEGPFYESKSQPSVTGPQQTSGTTADSVIRAQIDAVERSGRYARLPRTVGETHDGVRSGMCSRTIENHTAYTLTVLLAGPSERQISIAAGSRQDLELPTGLYRIVGRVPDVNVLPFFGEERCDSGSRYVSRFEIH